MNLFLSFLTVGVVRSNNHLGNDTDWTQLRNDELKLIIGGGMVFYKGEYIELLNSIEYGKNLSNRHTNYVNPFYLFDIMNDAGCKFFTEYYKEDILKIIQEQKDSVSRLQARLSHEEAILSNIETEYQNLLKL